MTAIPSEPSPTAARVRIRQADPADAPALARLCCELGYETDEPAASARLGRMLGRSEHEVLVAEIEGRVVGVASLLRAWTLHDDAPSARLSTLAVDSGCRGRGIGAALVAASERWARAQGATALHLTSGLQRAGAHAFYARLGYAQDGARFRKKLAPE